MLDFPLGLYEKVLPSGLGWEDSFSMVQEEGFSSMDLAVDPSAERLARLFWTQPERARVRKTADSYSVSILSVTLSAHRCWPLGSADPEIRQEAIRLATDAIHLAHDLGAAGVQLPGYFTYDEPSHPEGRTRFLEGLSHAAEVAARSGVTIAVENMDGTDVLDIRTALDLIDTVAARNLKLYVDVGNLAANGLDVISELRLSRGRCFAVQFKDALPGVYRRVPFGKGIVPFSEVIRELTTWHPIPVSLEMWNDAEDHDLPAQARAWLEREATFALA